MMCGIECEKLLGLAGSNTKKRGNKKSGESITPTCPHHRYTGVECTISMGLFINPRRTAAPRVMVSLSVLHKAWDRG